MTSHQSKIDLVSRISSNFKEIISREEIAKYPDLDWGNNGIGDRWAGKKFNYTVIKKIKCGVQQKCYSENIDDIIPKDVLDRFTTSCQISNGIIGIFVHSVRTNIQSRPIREDIGRQIRSQACVSCGSKSEIICDHKNDMYNDSAVLIKTQQVIDDFQPLCNHCNLQKRQIFREEVAAGKIYSAKNLEKYRWYFFEFPWEKKHFDLKDPKTKEHTYWYDPVEFNRKIMIYTFLWPTIVAIKRQSRL
jgi:hypothetical protein